MSIGKTIFTGVLLLALAAGGTYLYKPELLNTLSKQWQELTGIGHRVPGSYIGKNLLGSDWADPEMVQEKVAADVTAQLAGLSPDDVSAFLREPQHRLLIAQWMLAQAELSSAESLKERENKLAQDIEKLRTNIQKQEQTIPAGNEPSERLATEWKKQHKNLADMEKEALQAHSLVEAISRPGAQKLMEQLGNNLDWAEQVAFTGECEAPGTALAILADIVRKHPDLIYNQMERDIATATAVEFARSGWNHVEAVRRADFFLKNRRKGKLNKVFDTLPFWQRRIVCGCKGDNDFGSVESMQWSLDNVHLPADHYPSCCWRCGYKLYNLYGESIHGSGYVEPFSDLYGRNRAKFTYEVGGVCGGLSHFGAFSALANGIPALTCGEPGHCSFIVLVGDKWTPAYSLSWKRGLHWRVWKNISTFSSLHMMTELLSPREEEKTRLSNTYRALAGIYASQPEKALACYARAADAQPLNFQAWREYAAYLEKQKPEDTAAWKELHDAICRTLTPRYPEMAAELLRKHVYDGLGKAYVGKEKELQGALLAFWNHLSITGPDRWDVEGLADAQKNLLGLGKDSGAKLCPFYGAILGAVASLPEYAPIVLSWGNTLASKMKPDMQSLCMKTTLENIGKGKDITPEDRDKMLAQAVLASENMGDISTFQAIGKMLSPTYTSPKDKMPEHTPCAGKLVSQGGLIRTSTTSRFDDPCAHWGVLEPVGGRFHTNKDKDAWVMVQLPRQAHLTGVVLVATSHNRQRLHHMKVQISETGKDDDWQDVAELGECKQRVMAVDLGGARPRAKYVRIMRVGGPEFFHLNGIYIYGEPAA